MNNKSIYFYLGALLFALVLTVLHFSHGALESVLMMNGSHSPFLDKLFVWATKSAEWPGYLIALSLLLVLRKWYWALALGIMAAVTSLTSWFLKSIFFPEAPRPRKVLNDDALIHFMEGIEVNLNFSYPSGHTLGIMALACLLSWLWRKHVLAQFALLSLVIFAGLSRAYLFQHFFIDIATSVFIGIAINGALLTLFEKYLFKHHEQI